MSVDSFGIDMSCTRVKLCSMKEVIFTACIPQGGKGRQSISSSFVGLMFTSLI